MSLIIILCLFFGLVFTEENLISPPRLYQNGKTTTLCVDVQLQPHQFPTQLCGPAPMQVNAAKAAADEFQIVNTAATLQQPAPFVEQPALRDAEPPCGSDGRLFAQRALMPPQMYQQGPYPQIPQQAPYFLPQPPHHMSQMGRFAEERSIIVPAVGQGRLVPMEFQQPPIPLARSDCDEFGRAIHQIPARSSNLRAQQPLQPLPLRQRPGYLRANEQSYLRANEQSFMQTNEQANLKAAEATNKELLKDCDEQKKMIVAQQEEITKLKGRMDSLSMNIESKATEAKEISKTEASSSQQISSQKTLETAAISDVSSNQQLPNLPNRKRNTDSKRP